LGSSAENLRRGSVANSVSEGIEGFNLHILQTGIANLRGNSNLGWDEKP
jgi:hypothetical protein